MTSFGSRLLKRLFLIMTIIALETAAIAQTTAESLYTEGQAAYDRGDYGTAIGKWQASYDLSKESALLFNLAQAKRLLGDCVDAIAAYRRFMTSDANKTSDQHKLAKDFVRELDDTCPKQTPEPVEPPPKFVRELNLETRLSDHKSGRAWKITGLVTGGFGIATLAIGAGLGYHGVSIGNEITDECATSCDWAILKDKDARGRREVAIGKAIAAVGAAAIAGGVIFYYLGVRQEALTVAPAPSGSGGGGVVSWSGSW